MDKTTRRKGMQEIATLLTLSDLYSLYAFVLYILSVLYLSSSFLYLFMLSLSLKSLSLNSPSLSLFTLSLFFSSFSACLFSSCQAYLRPDPNEACAETFVDWEGALHTQLKSDRQRSKSTKTNSAAREAHETKVVRPVHKCQQGNKTRCRPEARLEDLDVAWQWKRKAAGVVRQQQMQK